MRTMLRFSSASLLSSALLACAGHESPATGGDSPEGQAREGAETCDGLLLPGDISLRQTGQGSHGAATTDISLDLKTGKMTGSDYTLDADGNTPIALTVDQQVSPEALKRLRQRFEGTCAPRHKVDKQQDSVPGGSSMMQVEHADGSLLFITIGGAVNLPAGSTVADVAREDWLKLFEAWPSVDGKSGSGDASD